MRLFSEAIAGGTPSRRTALLKPVTMSFFGHGQLALPLVSPRAGLTRADYADLVTRLIAEGARGIAAAPAPERRAARGDGLPTQPWTTGEAPATTAGGQAP